MVKRLQKTLVSLLTALSLTDSIKAENSASELRNRSPGPVEKSQKLPLVSAFTYNPSTDYLEISDYHQTAKGTELEKKLDALHIENMKPDWLWIGAASACAGLSIHYLKSDDRKGLAFLLPALTVAIPLKNIIRHQQIPEDVKTANKMIDAHNQSVSDYDSKLNVISNREVFSEAHPEDEESYTLTKEEKEAVRKRVQFTRGNEYTRFLVLQEDIISFRGRPEFREFNSELSAINSISARVPKEEFERRLLPLEGRVRAHRMELYPDDRNEDLYRLIDEYLGVKDMSQKRKMEIIDELRATLNGAKTIRTYSRFDRLYQKRTEELKRYR